MIGRNEKEKHYGYVGYTEERYNVLQVKIKNPLEILKKRSMWKDVEKEHVPSYVSIAIGTLGFCDWKSLLHDKCKNDLSMM
jgi:hypothetical protein